MPGRVANGRRTVSSNASAKSLRNSSQSVEVPDEGTDSSLRQAICILFADAQKSTAGHRKATISLRKVQEACCYEPVSAKKGNHDDFDEDDFNREVQRCVLRILPVRKAESVGDRVVRFLGTFLNVASAKDNEIAQQDEDLEEGVLPETPTSRLTTQLLETLVPIMRAKDKTIRFRATQITSHVINSLDTLDDSLFHKLRQELLKRIHDKEAPVRLQAVYGLGRLAQEVDADDEEDSDSEDDAGKSVLTKLLNVLQNDPSAEVRRNLLLNLPITKETLPYLLERARDADATTRRALYGKLLPALGDFRHLSLSHRDKLLRWGLRDRDENVRKSTARLFCERWIEDCAAVPAAQAAEQDGEVKPADQAAVPSLDALLELLERIDVMNSGNDNGIALVAMREFWEARPDYVSYVSFPDSFWEDLTPELAFVARTFNEYCRSSTNSPRDLIQLADEKLPEVTKFGFLLESEIRKLCEATIAAVTGEDDEAEEDVAQREFVVENMLQMSLTFDYSDEVGRRKMMGLMREALSLADLPEEVTRLVVENLLLVCGQGAASERQFCEYVLDAIAEVHDAIMGDMEDHEDSTEESFHSANSEINDDDDTIVVAMKKKKKQAAEDPEAAHEKAVKEIMTNMKCLHIALCMLQNVQCDLTENAHLVTMLNNLVVPAVRSQEAPVRERGLMCLGLCCLLGMDLAQENMKLFLHCFNKGSPALQATALQIITDILIVHPALLATPPAGADESEHPNECVKPLLKAYKSSIKSDEPEVQAIGASALSKVMLQRLVTDTDLLRQLVVSYFDPDTKGNAALRQSLSYFLPVYCHSRAENAMRMAEVATSVISKLQTIENAIRDDDDEDADPEFAGNLISLSSVANMLLDWTDPRKLHGFSEAINDAAVANGAGETHYVLAESILDRLVAKPEKEKKLFFGILNKVHLPAGGARRERVESILELIAEVEDGKVATDATSKNVLKKLQATLLKQMHDFTTEERGGGDTVLESTELGEDQTEVGDSTQAQGAEEEEEDQDSDMTQLQQELDATTMGFTAGLPDAEGTRIQLADDSIMEDSEMMDVDG